MPDWRQFVSAHLGPLGLPPKCEQEISVELADHLQDHYAAALRDGLAAEQAAAIVLDEVPDWAALNREIFDAKRGEASMKQVTRSLWLPGVAMLFLYAFLLRVVIWTGSQPSVFFLGRQTPLTGYMGLALVFYLPWLILLPIVGALGAYWSKRSGGGVLQRLLVGMFPATLLLALFLCMMLLAFVADPHVPLALKFAALGTYIIGWVLIPGAALFIGVLPFLRNHQRPRSAGVVSQ